MNSSVILLIFALAACVFAAKDMMRKSIVFDKNTPDVFYCPIHKPTGFDKLIVKARSLKKLCEFEGNPLPEDYKSDCYQDVDESDYACKEKYRIMMRMHPPGSDDEYDGTRMARFIDVDKEYYVMKILDKKGKPKIHLANRLG
ncbi:uncharacterized protein LOC108904094 [Anoplophora glabripennis]|uniref:uncharacterized protein LOC108904094 n=1 Tax=Anoplophora glabripennis TaxID=217634 RepID=UPI000874F690|nr:uncharacterized protein LOC108904094 [Anoplophora glabripennis]XP_018562026.1 uncharacterized protein LOC108904094 [Anoplophora glabripennis]